MSSGLFRKKIADLSLSGEVDLKHERGEKKMAGNKNLPNRESTSKAPKTAFPLCLIPFATHKPAFSFPPLIFNKSTPHSPTTMAKAGSLSFTEHIGSSRYLL